MASKDRMPVRKGYYYFQLIENAFVMAEADSRKGIEKALRYFGLPKTVIDDVGTYQCIEHDMETEILNMTRELQYQASLASAFGVDSTVDIKTKTEEIRNRYEQKRTELGDKIYEITFPGLRKPIRKAVKEFFFHLEARLGEDGKIIRYEYHEPHVEPAPTMGPGGGDEV